MQRPVQLRSIAAPAAFHLGKAGSDLGASCGGEVGDGLSLRLQP